MIMPNENQRQVAALPAAEAIRTPSLTPEQFIRKWRASTLSERSAAQQHFLDLCNLLGEATPAEADPTGETFTFEKGGKTATGGKGWADVWKKGVFAWEYKGPGKDLTAAYLQLKKYADMLENPPLLIVSDTKRIEIHTNFTNTVKVVHVFEITGLADSAKREILRAAFSAPERLRPGVTRRQVTTEAAQKFSQLAHALGDKGYEPQRVAHFLNRLIFCMFAEDVGLLPNRLFTKLVTASVAHPETFQENARQLFAGMAKGGSVAFEVVEWFNGGLFEDDATLPLNVVELKEVLQCAELDWSNIEPSIFGTLFERGLDPDKRSQQGTHYTDPDTILKIVQPVVLEPWQREWEQEKLELAKQIERAKKTVSEAAKRRYFAFLERLQQFRVLDPACGSGNFLYLSLRGLKDFEKRVILEAEALGLPLQFPRVGPEAVLGIEVNSYAAELARVTIWIGEIQWMIENGFSAARNPILKSLNQIECRDAVLGDDGQEPAWPTADVIVGNPPFLGDKKLLRGLGEAYVARLRACYDGRLPGGADLCCYWFEKMRSQIKDHGALRGGLVATDNIRRSPKNRVALEHLAADAEIFEAWTDQPWVNEGAAVRVSLICCGAARSAQPMRLNGSDVVGTIKPDLSASGAEAAGNAQPLKENAGIAFSGITKKGPFDISGKQARAFLQEIAGPHGRTNSEVVHPWKNGEAITGRSPDKWIISFGEMTEAEASQFVSPFAHVLEHVKPARDQSTSPMERRTWWLLARRAPDLFAAIAPLSRFLVTPEVSKHRVFVWLPAGVVPDKNLVVIARDDDVTFGVLQSRIHSLWALRVGTRLEDRPRYTSTTTFRTFPFPEGATPILAPASYTNLHAPRIAEAARALTALRDRWLNPPELVRREPDVVPGYPERVLPVDAAAEKELGGRTLTKLYNNNPPWLQHAHRALDEAVAVAYGWQWPLSDDEILERLFKLNHERT